MDSEGLKRFSDDVALELEELKKLGVKVSKKTLGKARDVEVMREYEDMKTSEAADLLMALYN